VGLKENCMESFSEYMNEYKTQLQQGSIQRAYKGLMEYIMGLRTHFATAHPDYSVPGNIYYGYMDMTYFAVIPPFYKQRDLKIAVVFLHEACRFEVWLAGYNKQVQTKYWKIFKESGWDAYRLVPSPQGADSILEHTLVDNPDFGNLEALTKQIERETLNFIHTIENFLSQH
jgi:hypothetical protein